MADVTDRGDEGDGFDGFDEFDGDDEFDEFDEFEGDDGDDGDDDRQPVRAIDRFQYTAVGGVLAAGMLGLRDVFEPRREDRPAIVVDWSGAPPFGDRILLRLDPDNPEDSIVVVRRRPD